MAIEFIPKPEIEKSSFEEKFPIFLSAIFLVISAIIFLFLNVTVKNSEKKLQSLEAKIEGYFSPEIKEKESIVLGWKQKIEDYNVIFGSRKNFSKVFALLEETIHPKVWFSSVNIDSGKQTLELKGRANDFAVLAEQIFILETKDTVEKTQLTGVNFTKDGDVEFDVKIFLKSKIF